MNEPDPNSTRSVARELQARGVQVSHTAINQQPHRVIWADGKAVGWVKVKLGRPAKKRGWIR